MTLPVPTINVYFGLEYGGGDFFILDDPVKGVIDNTTYLIASDDGAGINIATSGFAVSVRRGRSRELDEFEAGTATVLLRNFDRAYDALNAAGVYYGDLVPGRRIEVGCYGQMIFAGTIEDWDIEWTVEGDATARIVAIDALGQLARKEFDAWTTTDAQTASARLTDILNRPEVAFGPNRDLVGGASTLQDDNVTWGSEVLNYAQLVARSDLGRLYASRTNLVTFRDRHSLVASSASIEFRDDGAGVAFHGITTDVGSELLYNRVGIDRLGGTLQTVEDATSQDQYGVRALSFGELLMNSDAQSEDMAEYLLGIYKDPAARISSITVKLHGLAAADQSACTGLEIGDLVRVVWTPLGVGDPVDQTVVVEGLDHDISLQEYVMTIRTAPAYQSAVFILDDPVKGVIDNTTYLIAF